MTGDTMRRVPRTQRADSPAVSTLGVLRALAGLVPPVLLALDLARIARHEPGLLERAAQLGIGLHERAGDPVPDRHRLRRNAAADDARVDAVLAQRRGHLERLVHDHAGGLAPEVLVERAFVDDHRTVTALQT